MRASAPRIPTPEQLVGCGSLLVFWFIAWDSDHLRSIDRRLAAAFLLLVAALCLTCIVWTFAGPAAGAERVRAGKAWTAEEDTNLYLDAPYFAAKVLALRMGRTEAAIRSRARHCGITLRR